MASNKIDWRKIVAEFNEFDSFSTQFCKGPHVHQPTRNVNPKTGMINGGQGRQTKNNGVTEPGRKDIK